MVYIPYPRVDLNIHPDLIAWHAKLNKGEGDWTALKAYLAASARLTPNIDPITKCWYSELPQGDDFALDVEHYRPKNNASPLTAKQIALLEKKAGVKYQQATDVGNYLWLMYDYRNYRIVSAVTNRGGAKHIYFPIAKGKGRLIANGLPWESPEFPYMLDPTDIHDASLLIVFPNGEIAPKAAKMELTQADFDALPESWHSQGFNYIRAMLTIQLYRLDNAVFVNGRKAVYDAMVEELSILTILLSENPSSAIISRIIQKIVKMILPSAPFSLAAKCAMIAYTVPVGTTRDVEINIALIISQIQNDVKEQIESLAVDWTR